MSAFLAKSMSAPLSNSSLGLPSDPKVIAKQAPHGIAQGGYYSDSHSLEQRRRWYDPVAEAYDRARPRYPAELLDRAMVMTELKAGDRLLEIGCGPGIATLPLAQRGFAITAVEPSAAGCAILRERCAAYPTVDVVNQTFEEWPIEADVFDAMVAATSFHWVSPELGYPKIYQALKPGGYVLLLWNVPPQPSEAVWRSLQPIYDAHGSELETFVDRAKQEQQLREVGQKLVAFDGLGSGGFVSLGFERIDCELAYTVEDYLALLQSLSPYILLEAEQRAKLMNGLESTLRDCWGEQVQTFYFSALEVFQKVS